MNEVLYYGGSIFKDYHKSLYIGLFLSNREVLNIPAMNHIRPADFLPRCVYYHSKCCMEIEKRKNNITGRKKV
jgi:hypothetical protein